MARSDPPPNVVSRLRNHATHGHPWPCACVACREDALEADQIAEEEECALRDHLLAVRPRTIQPATLGVLLKRFVVTEGPPPAA